MKRVSREEILAWIYEHNNYQKALSIDLEEVRLTRSAFRDYAIQSGLLSSPTTIKTKWESIKGLPYATPGYQHGEQVYFIKVSDLAADLAARGYLDAHTHTQIHDAQPAEAVAE